MTSSRPLLEVLTLIAVALLPSPIVANEQAADSVRVTGALVLDVPGADKEILEIELPDRQVTLRGTGGDVDTATTALDGRFSLRAPGKGVYQVCWAVGTSKGCGERVVVSGGETAYAKRVHIRLEQPFVYGKILTGDLRPCWLNDSFFDIDVSTKVTGGGASTRANTHGDYALIGPRSGTFRVTARCEGAKAGETVSLSNGPIRQDLPLGNHAPKIMGLSAFDEKRAVTRVFPGQSVKLLAEMRATPAPVEFVWRTLENTSNDLTGGNTSEQKWALPAKPGFKSAYLMARDGRGGFAFRRVDVQVGASDVDFSGRVIDERTGQPIKDAKVAMGDGTAEARTNEFGWFSMKAKPQEDSRYVVNVTHPDYALVSRIADRSTVGGTFEMQRAQIAKGNGDQSFQILDEKSGGLCEGRDQKRRIKRLVEPSFVYDDVAVDPKLLEERRRDEAKLLETLPKLDQCDRRGAELAFSANALVDANGKSWSGEVQAAVTTLDPAQRSLPGDYQAVTAGGERTELLSFGAVTVNLSDPAGRPLRIKPGETAEVTIPISDQQKAAAPPTMPIWSYDEKSGLWREEGPATLTNTPRGPAYVGKTTHFSTLNMDVAGNDPAVATCVRFELDPAFNAWSNLVIRAYVSYNGNSVQVKETPLDGAQYHAIYRIPYQTGTPTTLRLELRGVSNGQNLILLDNIIATDARPKMTGNNLWPPYPYAECGAPVLLTPAAGVVPNWGDYDAAGRPAFLGGPYGNFNPEDGAAQSASYYAAVDPGNAKTTLGAWWQANGFGADGQGAGNANYVRQAYLNFNDLGFGRDMHCTKTGAKVACYVTNYGLPDQNPNNADAAETQDATRRGATVTMEYDNTATVNPSTDVRVQFYVYGGGDAGSARINFADLDGFGPKPVPFLCSVCHGGGPDLATGAGAANKANFARFREFDLPSFHYSGGRTWDYGQSTLNAAEILNFAKLNRLAHDAPSSTAISALIDAWYTGGLGAGAPVIPAPPAGWAPDPSGYHNVFGKSCRTCHVARDEGDANNYILFNDKNNFAGTGYTVCGTGNPKRRIMPNAVVTYKNFWADSLRVAQYETLTNTPSHSCDNN